MACFSISHKRGQLPYSAKWDPITRIISIKENGGEGKTIRKVSSPEGEFIWNWAKEELVFVANGKIQVLNPKSGVISDLGSSALREQRLHRFDFYELPNALIAITGTRKTDFVEVTDPGANLLFQNSGQHTKKWSELRFRIQQVDHLNPKIRLYGVSPSGRFVAASITSNQKFLLRKSEFKFGPTVPNGQWSEPDISKVDFVWWETKFVIFDQVTFTVYAFRANLFAPGEAKIDPNSFDRFAFNWVSEIQGVPSVQIQNTKSGVLFEPIKWTPADMKIPLRE